MLKEKNQSKERKNHNPFPQMEEDVLGFWDRAKIFEKSAISPPSPLTSPQPSPFKGEGDKRKRDRAERERGEIKDYVFYDGPPFATGLPHYGHIVASIMKDAVPRYWTMRGCRVERRWGWDCHGLPIENLAEKELKLKDKNDIERVGVEKFNDYCRSTVLRFADEWKKTIKRIGRWVDMKNDYQTMNSEYMESIWWVFKSLWDKGLIYQGHKAMHICPRCGTTLSNFEVTQGYKDIRDISCTVKFKARYLPGKTGRGVGALITNNKEEILLVRRNEKGRRVTWALPGGKVDQGETFVQALKREVSEELGVEVESAEPFNAQPDIFEGRLFETVTYKVKIKGEPRIMVPRELDKLEWFTQDALPEVDYPPSGSAIKKYLNNKGKFYISEDVSRPLALIHVLAWTTTPWTLIGNVALAAGENIDYVIFSLKGHSAIADGFYVVSESDYNNYLNQEEYKKEKSKGMESEIVSRIKGKELIDLDYEPLFDYYKKYVKQQKEIGAKNIPESQLNSELKKIDLRDRDNKPKITEEGENFYSSTEFYKEFKKWRNAYKVYPADFVTTEEGTGIVHIAPAFGEDDMELGKRYDLPFVQHVDGTGRFTVEVADWPGKEVKPKDDPKAIDREIVGWLKEKGKLFFEEEYEHSYPHCWRCDTPLLNYAAKSWFVAVTKIKDELIKNNKNVHWAPDHIKEGRFGKWLEQARDWAISRNRYWGTPLPVWECSQCRERKVIGSIEELADVSNVATKIIFVRHGESEKNLNRMYSSAYDSGPLTDRGIEDAEKLAEALNQENISAIYSSPVKRAKQTADIIAEQLRSDVIVEEDLREVNSGNWEKKRLDDPAIAAEVKEYHSSSYEENYVCKRGQIGESWQDVENRVYILMKQLTEKHSGQTIVLVTHQVCIVYGLKAAEGLGLEKTVQMFGQDPYQGFAMPIPIFIDHKTKKRVDLHKQFVDQITWPCAKCGGAMRRIGEVLDCWFESGSMPYAQMHYPFANKEKLEKNFPADFIAEGLDQTRGWFYTLMVLSTALFNKQAFNNCIVNGIVLAEDGQKMSKRLNNYPDPTELFEKYSVDALRCYLLSSPVMLAENLNFSEKDVQEVLRKVEMILWNVYKFYAMYAPAHGPSPAPNIAGEGRYSGNVLDLWLLARLDQLIGEATKQMDDYVIPKAIRPIEEFINDLSTWYLRRSRDRFKSGDEKDKQAALQTTGYALIELSKIMAPFMPFIAEQIWQKVTGHDFQDENKSVHLESWPIAHKLEPITHNEKILGEMERVRKIVELGLAARDEAGIKVRQPLQKLEVRSLPAQAGKKLKVEYIDLIKNEVNVKEVVFDEGEDLEVKLDTKITPELKQEGIKRELVRFINNMRKQAGLTIQDRIVIYWASQDKEIKKAVDDYKDEIKQDTLAKGMDEGKINEVDLVKEMKVDGAVARLGVKKLPT